MGDIKGGVWCAMNATGIIGPRFSEIIISRVDLGGLVVSVLATGPKVRGFDKNPEGK